MMKNISNQDFQQAEGAQSTKKDIAEQDASFREALRQLKLTLSKTSKHRNVPSLIERLINANARCANVTLETLVKENPEEAEWIYQEMNEIFHSDDYVQFMQELEITHGQSDKILPPGRDAIRTEERQTQAGMDDALNTQSQCNIERVADIATQLLSIKESINKEHKQRFESLIRMLCRDFSERLSVLHRFLVMMTKPDSPDRDDFAFNFHRFRSIVSQRLSSDQRIVEVQRIATTEIETPTTSTALVPAALQDIRRAIECVDKLAGKLENISLSDIVVHERDLTLVHEELSRAYANLAKSELGKKEALVQY